MKEGKPHRKVDLELRFEGTDWQGGYKKGDWFEGEQKNREMGFVLDEWW